MKAARDEDDDGRDEVFDVAADLRALTRTEAMALYLELRDRQLQGGDGPGDARRRLVLGRILERTGGLPRQLRWLQHEAKDEG